MFISLSYLFSQGEMEERKSAGQSSESICPLTEPLTHTSRTFLEYCVWVQSKMAKLESTQVSFNASILLCGK